LSIIGTLNMFDIILVLTGGGPGRSTTTLSMYVYRILFGGNTYVTPGYAAALSTIQFVIVAVIVIFVLRRLTGREVEQ
jgi:ABC-type sugar transport system permease subunit